MPDLEQYYFFVFMKWPHPEEIDPLERIKKSFISEKVSSKWKEDIRGRNFTEISYWEQLAVWNRFRYGEILERKQIRFSIYFFKMAYENDDSCDCIFWQKWMEGS